MQTELTLPDLWRIFQRRKYLIITTTVLISLAAVVLVPAPKARYSASAYLELAQQNTLAGLLLTDILSFSEGDNIATQSKIVTSQRIVFLAAQRLEMIDPSIKYKDFSRHPELFDKINLLQGSLTAEPLNLKRSKLITDIIKVTATMDNPSLAITFVNAIVDVYREETLRQQKKRIIETKVFIQKQLAKYSADLENSEKRLLEYVRNTLPGVELKGGDVLEIQVAYGYLKERTEHLKAIRDKLIQRKNKEINYDEWSASASKIPDHEVLFSNLIKLEERRSELLQYQHRQSSQVQAVERQIEDAIDAAIKDIDDQLGELKIKIKATLDLLERNVEYERMQREVELNENIVKHLSTSFQDALIQGAKDYENVRIVEFATTANEIIGAGRTARVAGLTLIGFVIGIAIAYILETFDTSIVVIEDVENYLQLPVLGVIPHMKAASLQHASGPMGEMSTTKIDYSKSFGLVTHFSPKSIIAESYRSLRTNLDFARSSSGGKIFLITSSTLREGKSTTITNLAITFAQKGEKVLLIGCNLRRPFIYRLFGLERSPGVTDIIHETVSWRDAVKDITDMFFGESIGISDLLLSPGLDNLHIITAGATPPNPAEMLSLPKFKQFLQEAREEYDIIFIDCPPILPVTDAALIAPLCDYAIIVYQIGRVSRSALGRTKMSLEIVNANILGVVLNDIKAELERSPYSAAHYVPYYGEDKFKGRVVKERGKGRVSSTVTSTVKSGGKIVLNPLAYIKKKFGT